jgi:hypothetical protein
MTTRFVMFTDAQTRESILVNPDHVRTALPSGSNQVTLVMGSAKDHHGYPAVVGDLQSVWEKLEDTYLSASPEPLGSPSRTPLGTYHRH